MAVDALEEFRAAIAPLESEWAGIHVRVMGLSEAEGKPARIHCITSGVLHEQEDLEEAPPDVRGVLFRQEVLNRDQFHRLLECLCHGRAFQVDGQDFILVGSADSMPWTFNRFEQYRGSATMFTLEAENHLAKHWADARDVDKALRHSDRPWDGLDEVVQNFLEYPKNHGQMTKTTAVYMACSLGVDLMDWNLQGRQLEMTFTSYEALDPDELRLGVIAMDADGPIDRFQLSASSCGFKRDGWWANLSYELAPDVTNVQVIASYRGYPAGGFKATVTAGNDALLELRALNALGGREDFLDKLLPEPSDRDSSRFEHWVTALFHVLGFSTFNMSDTRWHAPDVIAHARAWDWTVLIECTTGVANNKDKLGKLYQRAKRLEEAIGHEVIPVLATNLGRDHLSSAQQEEAAKDRISLLPREVLLDLMEKARAGIAPADVRTFLQESGQGWMMTAWPTTRPRRGR